MPLTKEEAARLGYKIHPIKHSKKRRAVWHDYSRTGIYLITIHIAMDDDGRCYEGMLLSRIVGDPTVPMGAETYPRPELTDLGRLVDYKIDAISSYPQFKNVEVKARSVMPTHLHLILEVKQNLPYYVARKRNYHLGDLVRGFKQGCTSLFKRWMKGESVDDILATLTSVNGREEVRTYTTTPGGKTDITLWEDKYNDRVLIDEKSIKGGYNYVEQNAWFWQMETMFPHLFQHRLHLTIAGSDYSCYGGLFILYRGERVQVMCHRLARRGMLTAEEWQKATASWDAIRAFENYSRKEKLGHFDRDWYRSNDPECITAVPYTRTEAFRKQKAEILAACEQDAVLVSPAISPGEKEILYAALEAGYPCIKLQAKPITEREHPMDKDREYCGRGLLVVLGPWKIKDANNYASRFGDAGSKYAQFHNLNDMAAEMCARDVNEENLDVDLVTLEECR